MKERLIEIAGRAARLGGWSVDLDRGVCHWTDEVCEIHEVRPGSVYTVEEALRFYAPEWRPVIEGHFRRCVEEGVPYDLDLEILTSSGRRVWVRSIGEAIRGEDGTVRRVQGAFQDISRRKEAEAALEASERRLRELAESMPHMVWSADPNGAIDYQTGSVLEYTGRTPAGLVGEGWLEVIHPDDRAETVTAWAESLRTERPYQVEFRIRRVDGEYRWHLTRARPARDRNGTIVKWYGSSTDIHDRRTLEAETRQLAERLTNTLESITDAFFTLDHDWRFTFLNSEAERVLERPRADLLGQVMWKVFPEAVETSFFSEFNRAVTERVPVSFEQWYPPLERWFSVRGYPSDEGLAVYFQDVSGERRANLQLREAEDRFRNVVRATTDAIWDWDLQDDSVWWSDGLRETFGIDLEALESDHTSWTHRIHPDDESRVVAGIRAAIEGEGASWEDEYRFRKEGGEYAWVVDRGFIVRDADGVAVRMVGGMSDATQHIEATRRIQEQADLLDRAQDAIVVRDLDNTIVYWNAGAERVYGWTREEAAGRSIEELLYSDSEPFQEATRQVLESGEWTGELQHLRKDGGAIAVESSWSLVRDEEGRPHRILAINTDITERKRLLTQFLRAQRMESIGTLAGGVAHDLNNVLAPILLAIGMLREEIEDEDLRSILETIEGSAQRGADMVKQVLAFARGVEGAQVTVDLERIASDLGNVVRDTFPKNIALRMDFPQNLWQLRGDPTQIHQVLMNLFVNARDAMPRGGTLRVSAESVELDEQYATMSHLGSPGPYVRITVADTGTGMEPEMLGKIFDPFFTSKEVGHGTGLGLSTVAAIVRSHGGFITVYSEPGRGSTFRVYLPASTGVELPLGGGPSVDLPRGHGELILVVDDESSVREITRQTLEAFGYAVLTAGDGAEALALYARQGDEIALVLTDIMMPVMDGPTTIRALRHMDPEVRIIAASGLGGDAAMAQASDAGIQHFLSKPYTADSLLRLLPQVLN